MRFERHAVESVGGDWEDFSFANEALDRLAALRKSHIERDGDFLRSKVAWKIALLQQSILYRLVALGEGTALMWHSKNVIGAILLARALIETVSLLHDLEIRLSRLADAGDLAAIDALADNRTFATRLEEWLDTDRGDTKAKNVLDYVDQFDKKVSGARWHYDRLSESCHPNSLGHFLSYATLDVATGLTTFSEAKWYNSGMLGILFFGYVMLGLVEDTLTRIDRLVDRVVELQDPQGV